MDEYLSKPFSMDELALGCTAATTEGPKPETGPVR
jgi:hypothetical protein